MVGWVVSKINLFTKIGTRIGSIGVVSNYVCRTSTKSANLASGHGIDNKNRHYQNYFKWIMFLAKIHRWRIIIAINFGSNFLWKLYRILKYPLKLKTFNLQGPCTSRGSNMAPQRFHVCNYNQPLHRVNFGVSLYFWLSLFNVDFDLLLLYHVQGSKAFPIHHVKLSSSTSRSTSKGQNSLDWIVHYTIGKLLELRCLKWAHMTHLVFKT